MVMCFEVVIANCMVISTPMQLLGQRSWEFFLVFPMVDIGKKNMMLGQVPWWDLFYKRISNVWMYVLPSNV